MSRGRTRLRRILRVSPGCLILLVLSVALAQADKPRQKIVTSSPGPAGGSEIGRQKVLVVR